MSFEELQLERERKRISRKAISRKENVCNYFEVGFKYKPVYLEPIFTLKI